MTSDNSGLLSDIVYDIDFNFKSGKIYFATDRGVSILHSPFSNVSYNNKDEYKIYFDQNPFIVPADEDLVISNIPLGSTITIMDLNGNVLKADAYIFFSTIILLLLQNASAYRSYASAKSVLLSCIKE